MLIDLPRPPQIASSYASGVLYALSRSVSYGEGASDLRWELVGSISCHHMLLETANYTVGAPPLIG